MLDNYSKCHFCVLFLLLQATCIDLSTADFCDHSKIQGCLDMMAGLQGRTDPGICGPLKTGTECLNKLRSDCGATEHITQINAALMMANAALTSFCADDASSSPLECSWEEIKKCTDPLQATINNYDPAVVCRPWTTGKICLDKLQPSCSPGEEKALVDDSLGKLDLGLSSLCAHYDHSEPGDNDGGCTMENINKCSKMLDELFEENHVDTMCNSWRDVIDCYGDILPACNDGAMKNAVESTLNSVQSNYHDTSCATGGGDCSAKAIQECTMPLQQASNNNQQALPEDICPLMMVSKECINKLKPSCNENVPDEISQTLNDVISQALDGIETNAKMLNCPLNDSGDKDVGCSMDNINKCSGALEKMAGEDNIEKMCSSLKDVIDCFGDILPACNDGAMKNAVQLTMNSVQSNYDGTCATGDGVCSTKAIHECTLSLQQMSNSNEQPSPEKICPVMMRSKDCITKLQPSCDKHALALEAIYQTLEGIDMNAKMLNCPLKDNQPGPADDETLCTGEKFQECSERLQTMISTMSQDKAEMCKVWTVTNDCLNNMLVNCDSGQIKTSVDSALKSFELSLWYCGTGSDADGNNYAECTWDSVKKCENGMKDQEMDTTKKCVAWQEGLDCYKKAGTICSDSVILQYVWKNIDQVEKSMDRTCPLGPEGEARAQQFDDSGADLTRASFPLVSVIVTVTVSIRMAVTSMG